MLCSFSQTGPPTAADKELRAPSTFTEQQASDKLQEKKPQADETSASVRHKSITDKSFNFPSVEVQYSIILYQYVFMSVQTVLCVT